MSTHPLRFLSQHGEDALLWEVFHDRSPGVFVEVGCIDGLRFSNTALLERMGWSGLCVEAHPDYVPLLRRNRPGSRVIHAAAGAEDRQSVTFYANARGSLSTLDRSLEERWRSDYGAYFTGFEETEVPLHSLNTILEEAGVADVDVLSIDVEGTELDVLRGLDLKRHPVDVLIIESIDEERDRHVARHLESHGLVSVGTLGPNRFFAAEAWIRERLLRFERDVELTETPNPFEEGAGEKRKVRRVSLSPGTDHRPVGGPPSEEPTGIMARRDPYRDLGSLVKKERPLILDAGAHLGDTVARFRQIYPLARILAVEPQEPLARRLRQRFRDDPEVRVLQKAIADRDGEVVLHVTRAAPAASVFQASTWGRSSNPAAMEVVESVAVPSVTLARLFGGRPPDILKLDLQGAELLALQGAGERIAEVTALIIEVEFNAIYEGQPLFGEVDAYLRRHGFQLFNLYELWTRPEGRISAGDALYLRPELLPAAPLA